MSAVPSGRLSRLRTGNPIDRFTIGKRRPQSGFQTADAKILSIGKVRPQYSSITDSGLPGGMDHGAGALGRSADRRRPFNQSSEAGAPARPAGRREPVHPGCTQRCIGASSHAPLEFANTFHNHHSTAKRIDYSAGAHQRARGVELLVGALRHADADRTNRHQRRCNQRHRPSCGARWWLEIPSRTLRRRAAEPAPARSPASPSPRHQGDFGKYLSPGRRHASATGPVNHRIWDFKISGFVFFRGADA